MIDPALICLHVLLVPHAGLNELAVVPMLYVGPDQIMPLTSVLGAIVGVLLMFWNRVVGAFVRFKNFLSRR